MVSNNDKRSPLANTIRSELKTKLKQLSDDTGINMNRLLDKAIELLLEDMKNKHI